MCVGFLFGGIGTLHISREYAALSTCPQTTIGVLAAFPKQGLAANKSRWGPETVGSLSQGTRLSWPLARLGFVHPVLPRCIDIFRLYRIENLPKADSWHRYQPSITSTRSRCTFPFLSSIHINTMRQRSFVGLLRRSSLVPSAQAGQVNATPMQPRCKSTPGAALGRVLILIWLSLP